MRVLIATDAWHPQINGVVRSIDGLADGVHTLRIVVLATARPAATGALVSVDRFSIVP